jgi:hypothetical protein
MRHSVALQPIVVGLVITCQKSVAQVPVAQDFREVTVYESFLHDVAAALNHPVAPDPPVKSPKPPIQKAIGLTDQEADALNGIAKDYETKNSLFLSVVRPLRMEALLQSLDSGQVSENLTQRISDLQSEHAKMVSDQVQRLRGALGITRFEVVNAFVRPNFSR